MLSPDAVASAPPERVARIFIGHFTGGNAPHNPIPPGFVRHWLLALAEDGISLAAQWDAISSILMDALRRSLNRTSAQAVKSRHSTSALLLWLQRCGNHSIWAVRRQRLHCRDFFRNYG